LNYSDYRYRTESRGRDKKSQLNGGPVEAWLFPEGKQEGLAGMVSGAFPWAPDLEAVRDPKARRMFLSPR
jgi:hypothetical protein